MACKKNKKIVCINGVCLYLGVRGLLFLRLWFIMMCLDFEKNSVVHLSLKLIQKGVELLLFGW